MNDLQKRLMKVAVGIVIFAGICYVINLSSTIPALPGTASGRQYIVATNIPRIEPNIPTVPKFDNAANLSCLNGAYVHVDNGTSYIMYVFFPDGRFSNYYNEDPIGYYEVVNGYEVRLHWYHDPCSHNIISGPKDTRYVALDNGKTLLSAGGFQLQLQQQ